MLLVYAMTRAAQHGWATAETIGLLATSAALVIGFVVIELRSKAPLLPLGIFRLRTLSASNLSGFLLAASLFSQFFLLTLYMQQVLHYSALKTGVAYIALTLTIIVMAGLAQALSTRFGVRPVLAGGMFVAAAAIALYAQLPVHGQYFWDLFPAFLLSGLGLAFAFIPMSIGALTGVRPLRGRRGVRVDQHEPADRRRDRSRGRDHDRDDGHGELRPGASRCEPARRRCAHSRLHDHVLRPRGNRGRGRARGGAHDRVGAGGGRGGARRGRCDAGGSMNAIEYDRDTHEINDVLTQLKGLVLVQPILEARGVSNEELERHTGEIDRVRAQLAELVRSSGGGVQRAAAA